MPPVPNGVVARAAGVFAIAAVIVAALAWDVTHDGPVAALDHRIGAWMAAHPPSLLHELMDLVSLLHKPRVIAAATIVVALVMFARRDRRGALQMLVTLLGGSALNHLLKHTLQRARPGMSLVPGLPTDFAFPSGHVANATLLYGMLVVLVLQRSTSPALRAAVIPLAVLMIALVATSRVVLGAHHPSDVIAGALVGVGWIALCMVPFALLTRRADTGD